MINRVDILIKNGVVLTIDSQMRVIQNGYVAVKDSLIVGVGSSDELLAANLVADEVIDAKDRIIMPGLINSHTHASMAIFRGIADDLPLMEWLNNHIFPAEAKLTPDLVYIGAKLACAEMILSGTTCFCDMYLFEDEVAKAAYDSSMRAVVGEVLYDFPSPCYGEIEKGFAYVEDMIDRWRAKSGSLIRVAVEPHSTYLCAPNLLQRAAQIANKNEIPLIIHVAETLSECSEIKKRYGATPVKFLADIGVLGPNLIACHSVHLTDEDIELYKSFDVKVAHCPESNMKLASGVAPIPKIIDSGICVGLGTDGAASNNDLDMLLEMDTAAKLHKVFTMNPEALDSKTAVKMATINGAKVLGLDKITGSLEVGKQADIIVIDVSAPHLVPMYNPYSHVVYSATGRDVVLNIIDGKIVMRDRRLFTIDIDSVVSEVQEVVAKKFM
ncbi:MAG: amidohydrolase [Desulfamplus sp.]|nr:amidohydrolase [Desulfamplus sp.]